MATLRIQKAVHTQLKTREHEVKKLQLVPHVSENCTLLIKATNGDILSAIDMSAYEAEQLMNDLMVAIA